MLQVSLCDLEGRVERIVDDPEKRLNDRIMAKSLSSVVHNELFPLLQSADATQGVHASQ